MNKQAKSKPTSKKPAKREINEAQVAFAIKHLLSLPYLSKQYDYQDPASKMSIKVMDVVANAVIVTGSVEKALEALSASINVCATKAYPKGK